MLTDPPMFARPNPARGHLAALALDRSPPGRPAAPRRFSLASTRTVETSSLAGAQISVTRLWSSLPDTGRHAPSGAEPGHLVAIQLRDAVGDELWKSGRRVPGAAFLAGSVIIADLDDEPALNLREPSDMLLIQAPRAAFEELAEAHGAPSISALNDQAGTPDPLLHSLARAMLPFIDAHQRGPQPAFDHVVFALYARLAAQYGQARHPGAERAGGLSLTQLRLAKAALTADLAQSPSITEVARASGLPVSRLARGFRLATGLPLYRWLRSQRIARAKDLLLSSPLSLAQIAYDCGFADQSHFTRAFAAAVGAAPGAWRRSQRG